MYVPLVFWVFFENTEMKYILLANTFDKFLLVS